MLAKNSGRASPIRNLLEERPLLFKKLFRLWLCLDVSSILIKFLLTVYIPMKLGHIILVEEYVPAMIADYLYLKNALNLPLKSIVPTINIISRLMLLCGSASIILLDADPHELKHRWSNRGRGLLEIPNYLNMQRTLLPHICQNLPTRWFLYINTTNEGVQETHRKIVRYLTENHESRLWEKKGVTNRPSARVHNFNLYLRKRYRTIAQLLNSILPQLVIDMGCGDGESTAYYQEQLKGCSVLGLDIKISSIWKKLKKTNNMLEFMVADINCLPLRPKCVDVITMTEVLEHIDKDILALNKIKQSLKDRGLLILSTPNGARLSTIFSRLRIRLAGMQRSFTSMDHRREYSTWELRKTLSKAGFVIISTNYIFFYPYNPLPFKWLIMMDKLVSKVRLSPFLKWGLIAVARTT